MSSSPPANPTDTHTHTPPPTHTRTYSHSHTHSVSSARSTAQSQSQSQPQPQSQARAHSHKHSLSVTSAAPSSPLSSVSHLVRPSTPGSTKSTPKTPPKSVGSNQSKSSSSPGRRDKYKEAKRPNLGGLSGADIDKVKRRPPTYQAKDADLRRLLNSGDYIPTEVRCDVCSSRGWPCVERRPSGRSKRAVATSCAGCQISHKKCRINGQRRADVLALRQAERDRERKGARVTIATPSEASTSRAQVATSTAATDSPSFTARRPPTLSPIVVAAPGPSGYWAASHERPPRPSHVRPHGYPHHPAERGEPLAYPPPAAYAAHSPTFRVRPRPYYAQQASPYMYASEGPYGAEMAVPSPTHAHPHSPYLRSPFRSEFAAYEYRRPPPMPHASMRSPLQVSIPVPVRSEYMLSPALVASPVWAHHRVLPPPAGSTPAQGPAGPVPPFPRVVSSPMDQMSPIHMNPIRPMPRWQHDREAEDPTLPSPNTILSWSGSGSGSSRSREGKKASDAERPRARPPHARHAPDLSWSSSQTRRTSYTDPGATRRSGSPPNLSTTTGLTTPPPSVSSGQSRGHKRPFSGTSMSTSSGGSGPGAESSTKRSRASWWHTLEDSRFPEARYHISDTVLNSLDTPFVLYPPRPRALRPVDAHRIPYLEHITQLDADLVRFLRRGVSEGENVPIPAYLYRPRVSCEACVQHGNPCIISGDDIEIPRHTPPGTMVIPLPPCLACKLEGSQCVYRLADREKKHVYVPLRVAMFESRPRLTFPRPLSRENIEQWGVCFSPSEIIERPPADAAEA